MPYEDWNLEASELEGERKAQAQEAQEKAERIAEERTEEEYHERRYTEQLCDICGLPQKDHRWKNGKLGVAGYCLFAPSGKYAEKQGGN